MYFALRLESMRMAAASQSERFRQRVQVERAALALVNEACCGRPLLALTEAAISRWANDTQCDAYSVCRIAATLVQIGRMTGAAREHSTVSELSMPSAEDIGLIICQLADEVHLMRRSK